MDADKKAAIEAAIADFEIKATYIPFDVDSLREKVTDPHYHGKGRLKAEDLHRMQLKYKVEVKYKGRVVFDAMDYSMGIGHIPAESAPKGQRGWTNDKVKWITAVMKTGKAGRWSYTFGQLNTKEILPEKEVVIWCLVMDSDVLQSGGFEDWASNFGYDTDSRKAEATYRLCLEQALRFTNAIGNAKLEELRTVYQDY